jgi:hypothetical protein
MVMSEFFGVVACSAIIAVAAHDSASAGSCSVAVEADRDKARMCSCRPVSTCTYDVNGQLRYCSVRIVCS